MEQLPDKTSFRITDFFGTFLEDAVKRFLGEALCMDGSLGVKTVFFLRIVLVDFGVQEGEILGCLLPSLTAGDMADDRFLNFVF